MKGRTQKGAGNDYCGGSLLARATCDGERKGFLGSRNCGFCDNSAFVYLERTQKNAGDSGKERALGELPFFDSLDTLSMLMVKLTTSI